MALLHKLIHFLSYTVPAILGPIISHLFKRSPTTSHYDFSKFVVVAIIRALFNDPTPVSMLQQQQDSRKDPGVKGKMWVVPDEFQPPEDTNVHTKVQDAIKSLGENISDDQPPTASIDSVHGEWVGYRSEVGDQEPEPAISAAEKFRNLNEEATKKTTILYLHGGQFL